MKIRRTLKNENKQAIVYEHENEIIVYIYDLGTVYRKVVKTYIFKNIKDYEEFEKENNFTVITKYPFKKVSLE